MLNSFVSRTAEWEALILFTLMLVVFIGFCALVVDVGRIYAERRYMQNAADAGALSATHQLAASFRTSYLDYLRSFRFLGSSGPRREVWLGKISQWDDAQIKRLNPGASLPGTHITVAFRSDGSGDTYAFTNYLWKVSSEWKSKVGASTSVSWPVGLGGQGNEGDDHR